MRTLGSRQGKDRLRTRRHLHQSGMAHLDGLSTTDVSGLSASSVGTLLLIEALSLYSCSGIPKIYHGRYIANQLTLFHPPLCLFLLSPKAS